MGSLSEEVRTEVLCGYICNLEAENKKLREQIADTCMQLGGAWARCSDLLELVRHLYKCMCNIDADGNYECDSCEYDNTEGKCDFEYLLRELGVEVDG